MSKRVKELTCQSNWQHRCTGTEEIYFFSQVERSMLRVIVYLTFNAVQPCLPRNEGGMIVEIIFPTPTTILKISRQLFSATNTYWTSSCQLRKWAMQRRDLEARVWVDCGQCCRGGREVEEKEMRRCRIVADAHNVVRRDAVCDVAAFTFPHNKRANATSSLHRASSLSQFSRSAFRLRLHCRENSPQDREIWCSSSLFWFS